MSNALMEREGKELQMQESVENTRPCPTYVPRADIYESKDQIVVLADMPGAHQDSVEITLENSILTVTASVEPSVTEGYSKALTEYGVGDFKRSFTLSNAIDREGIEASMKNGVLKLILPKSKSLLPKKIAVNSN